MVCLSIGWCGRAGAESIIQAAQVSKADVIVMATHGRVGISRAFAGSVSERVVADSGRPVLLLKPDDKRLNHIATLLVPVDGTAGGVLGLGDGGRTCPSDRRAPGFAGWRATYANMDVWQRGRIRRRGRLL